MVATIGEQKTNSQETFSEGFLRMDTLMLAAQKETYIHQLCADNGYVLNDGR